MDKKYINLRLSQAARLRLAAIMARTGENMTVAINRLIREYPVNDAPDAKEIQKSERPQVLSN